METKQHETDTSSFKTRIQYTKKYMDIVKLLIFYNYLFLAHLTQRVM